MRPDVVAKLANLRAEALAPGAIFVAIRSRKGSVAIFPDEIVGLTDDELLAFIAERLASLQGASDGHQSL